RTSALGSTPRSVAKVTLNRMIRQTTLRRISRLSTKLNGIPWTLQQHAGDDQDQPQHIGAIPGYSGLYLAVHDGRREQVDAAEQDDEINDAEQNQQAEFKAHRYPLDSAAACRR